MKAGLFLFFLLSASCVFSQDQPNFPFHGRINSDNINTRADATVNSSVVCALNKGYLVEVVSELYGWYKIRLPEKAPAYIRKDLLECIKTDDANNACLVARVSKNNVNIRFKPDESSVIVGKATKDELVNIRGWLGGWFGIEPTKKSFCWIHSKFVTPQKIEEVPQPQIEAKPETLKTQEVTSDIVAEGIIRPYGRIFGRVASHKLLCDDSNIILLKGDKAALDKLINQKIKVTGKKIGVKGRYVIIEITTYEAAG